MIDIAIVGLGSWGLCTLERMIRVAERRGAPVRIHGIEPGAVGGGAYRTDQPDYLVLNNACGQLSLFVADDAAELPDYARGLYEWAAERSYRWQDTRCRPGASGEPVRPTDYLPRRVMGEYLHWFYGTLLEHLPQDVEFVRHHACVLDVVPHAPGIERVVLDDGHWLFANQVVLTSGHTPNLPEDGAGGSPVFQDPYPIRQLEAHPAPAQHVVISGLGLVAFDAITALTIGRGGRFVSNGNRTIYLASGREPAISLFSRSGIPYCTKSASGTDPTGDYQPVVCTADALGAATRGSDGSGPYLVDFRADVLPLVLGEMSARYYQQTARAAGGPAAAGHIRDLLGTAWRSGTFDTARAELARDYGPYDPADHLFATGPSSHASSEAYEKQFYQAVADDADHSLLGERSPLKAAQEVFRILRDPLRSVIEFGGLSLQSYIDFQQNIRGRINRVDAGPPVFRSQQLLALMDAGIVRVPFGPSPAVTTGPDGRVVISSTRLGIGYSSVADLAIQGYLDLPTLSRTASPLLQRLHRGGRLTQLNYGSTPVGSVAISRDFHPFDAEGREQHTISVLGVLTEGARYFTHYLPSPRSRIRAVQDAQACAEATIAGT